MVEWVVEEEEVEREEEGDGLVGMRRMWMRMLTLRLEMRGTFQLCLTVLKTTMMMMSLIARIGNRRRRGRLGGGIRFLRGVGTRTVEVWEELGERRTL